MESNKYIMKSPTLQTYTTLDKAYEVLNKELFNNELPVVLITMQRKQGAGGYFYPDKFLKKGGSHNDKADEIAINPSTIMNKTTAEVLAILAHEMAHVWRHYTHGIVKNGYHDKQWAQKMEEIGLMPSHNGQQLGKKTGARMSHYIIEDGKFDIVSKRLLDVVLYYDETDKVAAKKKKASKTKYTCPDCNTNAWAKPETLLICGDCYRASEEIVHMVAEQEDDN